MKVVACVPFKNGIIYCDDGMSTVELYNDSVKNHKECTIRTILPLKSTEFITIQSLPIDVYDNRNLEKATYLLGSAFSFNRILDRTDYINLLLLIIENSEYPVFFFPHRYEELEVIQQLENMNVCQVCNIDSSIESYIYSGNVPSSIVSFNSTALYILSSALPYTSVRSIDATELMTSDDRERFKQTYDFFRDSCDSIEVLTVRDMNSARS
ncbi:hypothetical protein [Vibrio splendidus]|uniref:hypothetical protein n=1 Tax=Vibrio splendidus TaxID=29497 RepID=UPI0012D99DC5|nr:hypothetical protein [Vibrio splendidus]